MTKRWTTEAMYLANMETTKETQRDSYRLSIPKAGERAGIRLDVPGWMVGDPEHAATVLEAAKVIRKRLGVG